MSARGTTCTGRRCSMCRRAIAVIAMLALAGCGRSMAFVQDDRISFVAPTALERVVAPFTLEWTDEGTSRGGYAVFVDRDPIAPGDALSDLAEEACEGRAGCEGDAFFAAQRIYVTDETQV